MSNDEATIDALRHIMLTDSRGDRPYAILSWNDDRVLGAKAILDAIRDGRVPGVYFGDEGIKLAGDLTKRTAEITDLKARLEKAEAERDAHAKAKQNDRDRLQQKCSDWGTYWRESDAHGVNLNIGQAIEILQDALGVEVDIYTGLDAAIRERDEARAELAGIGVQQFQGVRAQLHEANKRISRLVGLLKDAPEILRIALKNIDHSDRQGLSAACVVESFIERIDAEIGEKHG